MPDAADRSRAPDRSRDWPLPAAAALFTAVYLAAMILGAGLAGRAG